MELFVYKLIGNSYMNINFISIDCRFAARYSAKFLVESDFYNILIISYINLVCPQTFSHTVMCKVCLTASNTLLNADAFVRLNH